MITPKGEGEAERAAIVAYMREAIAQGYPAPTGEGVRSQCGHGKFGFEDCIACYDEHLERALKQIAAGAHLNQEGQG